MRTSGAPPHPNPNPNPNPKPDPDPDPDLDPDPDPHPHPHQVGLLRHTRAEHGAMLLASAAAAHVVLVALGHDQVAAVVRAHVEAPS